MSEYGPEMVVGVPKGWQCPVCGRVYAPFMVMCVRCGEDGEGPSTPLRSAQDDNGGRRNAANAENGGEWVDVFRTCGKCGGRMQWHRNVMLTSLPPKWEYRCLKCGHVEYEECGTGMPTLSVSLGGPVTFEPGGKVETDGKAIL